VPRLSANTHAHAIKRDRWLNALAT
jgi:hypothetical protein